VKLIAMMVVHNEIDRYLRQQVPHLLLFCDEVRVVDDASSDGTADYLSNGFGDRVRVKREDSPSFYEHEGRLRQKLLEWTLEGEPTHILAIDADEFVSDGDMLRKSLDGQQPNAPVWTLDMQEIWNADDDALYVRTDGGWKPHPVPIVFSPPARQTRDFRISDRQLACGREPVSVRNARNVAKDSGVEVLHFGWAKRQERAQRYQRYVVADGGKFHRNAHLESIMWPDIKVKLSKREWPSGLPRDEIVSALT
jgi:glycosyltransferase involved in cell wall biosynthesis